MMNANIIKIEKEHINEFDIWLENRISQDEHFVDYAELFNMYSNNNIFKPSTKKSFKKREYFPTLPTLYKVPNITPYKKKYGIKNISRYLVLSHDCLSNNSENVDWKIISYMYELNLKLLLSFRSKLHLDIISMRSNLSLDFIEKCKDGLDWSILTKFHTLSEDVILNNLDKIPLDNLVRYQIMSIKTINNIKDSLTEKQLAVALANSLVSNDELIKLEGLYDEVTYLAEKKYIAKLSLWG